MIDLKKSAVASVVEVDSLGLAEERKTDLTHHAKPKDSRQRDRRENLTAQIHRGSSPPPSRSSFGSFPPPPNPLSCLAQIDIFLFFFFFFFGFWLQVFLMRGGKFELFFGLCSC
ncbi:hypothetical protein ACB092_02G043800 [Castanea dentata]